MVICAAVAATVDHLGLFGIVVDIQTFPKTSLAQLLYAVDMRTRRQPDIILPVTTHSTSGSPSPTLSVTKTKPNYHPNINRITLTLTRLLNPTIPNRNSKMKTLAPFRRISPQFHKPLQRRHLFENIAHPNSPNSPRPPRNVKDWSHK